MSGTRMIVAAVAVLTLSGCGTPIFGRGARQTAQVFIREHTECPVASYADPVWSPDGSHIYYTSYIDRSTSIHVMNSSGSGDRVLARDGNAPMPSPDGAMLLYHDTDPSLTLNPTLAVMDLNTGSVRQTIEIGRSASWSPDSQWIAFVRSSGAGGPIFKMNVFTGETVRLSGALWTLAK